MYSLASIFFGLNYMYNKLTRTSSLEMYVRKDYIWCLFRVVPKLRANSQRKPVGGINSAQASIYASPYRQLIGKVILT